MSILALATILVACAFMGLCIWVLWPGNKERFERYGSIPFQDSDRGTDVDSSNDGELLDE
jgi:cbb3-type cytochrome oxidase subunit 3